MTTTPKEVKMANKLIGLIQTVELALDRDYTLSEYEQSNVMETVRLARKKAEKLMVRLGTKNRKPEPEPENKQD